jgi:hypothetical protein
MANSTFSVTTPNGVVQSGDTVVARIQNRRGYKINLPQPLAPGELGWCIDTKELFIGLDSSTSSSTMAISNQVEAQRLLDEEMTEFQSKWGYLNGSVNGSVDSGGTTLSEEEFISNYLLLSPDIFLSDSTVVSDIESNVYTLTQFKNAIASSVPLGLQPAMVRVTTTEVSSVRKAVVQVNITGGAMTLASTTPDPLVDSDAGLGYFDGDTVYIPNGTGSSANFVVNVTDDGQGKVQTFSVGSSLGSGWTMPDGTYKMEVSAPDLSAKVAIADTTVVINGELQTPTVQSGGGEYRTKPVVEVRGGSAVVDATVEAIWSQSTRQVTGFVVTNPGSGYVSEPTIVVRPPLSKTMYRFRYDFGFPLATPSNITNINDNFNSVMDAFFPNTELVSTIAGEQSQLLGAGGQGKVVTIDASGQAILVMDTPLQASAATTILNNINSSADSIAQSSQNIEILTEFSSIPTPPPSVIIPIEDLESADLVPTGANAWSNVEIDDKLNPGNTVPLTFDPSVTNSIFLRYSVKHSTGDAFLRNGYMNVVVLDTETDLTTTSTEVKASPSLDASNIYFRTIMVSNQSVVQYWHTFPNNVEFKYASTEWLA